MKNNYRQQKYLQNAGLIKVTSAMCRHLQRDGPDVQCSSLVHNFNDIFSNEHLYPAMSNEFPAFANTRTLPVSIERDLKHFNSILLSVWM